MATNNSEFMSGMLFFQYELIYFTISIKLLFYNVFIGSFNIYIYIYTHFISIDVLSPFKFLSGISNLGVMGTAPFPFVFQYFSNNIF